MRFSRERTSARSQRVFVALLGCLSLFSFRARGQSPPGETSGTGTTSGQIIVTVREATGEPLSTPAIVRLYRADGMPFGQSSTSAGGRVTFGHLPLGDYTVVVEAPGYKTERGEAGLPIPVPAQVDIYLKPESSTTLVEGGPGGQVLAPKAQKELDLGLVALRGNQLDVAQKHLDGAVQLAPGHPDILYLLGVLSIRRNDLPHAQEFLTKATQMAPQHARALAALGTVLSNQSKFAAAIPPLEKALELNPHSWETHWTLAKACYYDRQFPRALKESQAALAASEGRAPEIELLVAQALTAVGRYGDSAQALRDFLLRHGDHPQAPTAQRWLDRLKQAGKIANK